MLQLSCRDGVGVCPHVGNVLYTNRFSSTVENLMRALTGALDALVERDWCNYEDSFGIRLCIEEALVNAVQHGNQNRPEKDVRIEVADMNDKCRIRVWDQGGGFDPEGIDMPDCNQLGGRGVCLIKHYMGSVAYDRNEKCLEMTFSRDTFK